MLINLLITAGNSRKINPTASDKAEPKITARACWVLPCVTEGGGPGSAPGEPFSSLWRDPKRTNQVGSFESFLIGSFERCVSSQSSVQGKLWLDGFGPILVLVGGVIGRSSYCSVLGGSFWQFLRRVPSPTPSGGQTWELTRTPGRNQKTYQQTNLGTFETVNQTSNKFNNNKTSLTVHLPL